jgi:carboxymethylenebutenolidase
MTSINQQMIALYDRFTHEGGMNRRELVAGMARLAGSTAAGLAALQMIEASAAAAPLTSEFDPNLAYGRVQWRLVGGQQMAGYLAHPKRGSARLPRVLVIHENRGINDHIRDITRRLGAAGFVALAPDFLSRAGETPRTGDGKMSADDIARAMIGQLDRSMAVSDGLAALKFLNEFDVGRGVPAAVGFCWGGGMVNSLAVAAGAGLRAGVVYYGPPEKPENAARIKARMLYHYAGLDERINASAPAWEQALTAAGVTFSSNTYPGVNHAFNNDTSEARYNRPAAEDAWRKTLAWLSL